MKKEPAYLKRYKQLFAHYVDIDSGEIIDLDFKEKVATIRKEKDEATRRAYANVLILKYKFPSVMEMFLKEFITAGKMDFNLIDANLFLVSPSAKEVAIGKDVPLEYGPRLYFHYASRHAKVDIRLFTASNFTKLHVTKELKLVIGKNTSIEQIVDFIRSNKEHIKEFQAQLPDDGTIPSRIRQRKNLQRDMRVKELKEQGNTRKQIVQIVNDEFPEAILAYGDVATILRNLDR